jgi:hypothetical protein
MFTLRAYSQGCGESLYSSPFPTALSKTVFKKSYLILIEKITVMFFKSGASKERIQNNLHFLFDLQQPRLTPDSSVNRIFERATIIKKHV